nr:uncharacterized protein LOC129384656 [Dermacentor andersoni]
MNDDESLFQEQEEAEIHDWASARGYREPAGSKAYSGKDRVAHCFTVTVVLAAATLPLLAVVGTAGLLYYNSWLAATQVRLADVQCESAGCQRLARFLEVSINRSADACTDFYGYVCSNQLYANTFKMVRKQI